MWPNMRRLPIKIMHAVGERQRRWPCQHLLSFISVTGIGSQFGVRVAVHSREFQMLFYCRLRIFSCPFSLQFIMLFQGHS